jgi:DNA processing protein
MNNLTENELLYAIALSMYKAHSDLQKRKQLQFYGSAYNTFKYRNKNLGEWPLLEAEDELKFIEKYSIQCFSILDKFYPGRLANISDPPNLLYVKGADHFNLPQLISIVGTRQHTYQVKKVVEELLEGLAHLKIGVISGLALGVDGIAHEAALKNNLSTWGVLAHGLDTIYPNQHRRLAKNMLENNGGLITECRINTPTMTFQFPKRNRIVAGMSDATIVIESEVKGGSMITAHLARGYDREVFAVPGKIHDAKSKGCLWLIKNNIATMYHDPIQLLEDMNWPKQEQEQEQDQKKEQAENSHHNKGHELFNQSVHSKIMNQNAKSIYLLIQSQGPIHKDSILIQLAISNDILAEHLLQLELNGHIHLLAGNLYACT